MLIVNVRTHLTYRICECMQSRFALNKLELNNNLSDKGNFGEIFEFFNIRLYHFHQ